MDGAATVFTTCNGGRGVCLSVRKTAGDVLGTAEASLTAAAGMGAAGTGTGLLASSGWPSLITMEFPEGTTW